jgi:cyclase
MLKKRIIATLVVKDNIVVQSIGFNKYLPIGSPLIAVEYLNKWGIDEIIYLDISSTKLNLKPNYSIIKSISSKCNVPLTIGGGIKNLEDIKNLINLGADKVSLNNILFENPSLISKAAKIFGNQCIVASIDIIKQGSQYYLYNYLTKKHIHNNIIEFINNIIDLGSGEIIVNNVDRDGSYSGYDIELFNFLSNEIKVPVIASGGAKNGDDFVEIFTKTNVSAASASNLFHFTEHSVNILKSIVSKKIEIRVDSQIKYEENILDEKKRLTKFPDVYLEQLLYKKFEKEDI